MSFAKSAYIAPKGVSRTPARVMCASFDVKKVVEIRKEIDKKRFERVKEIGSVIGNIARTEIAHTAETVKVFLPFIEHLVKKN